MWTFETDCVGSTYDAIHPMVENAIDITRRTFLAHVDREELHEIESQLGYMPHPSQGLTMAGDWYVSYHRSKFRGVRCYFFRWSGIEYVFTKRGTWA